MLTKTLPSQLPQHKVTIWEVLITVVSAIAIVSAGLIGLSLKFMLHASEPRRVEAISDNIMTYQVPGGVRGEFGINFAGAKIALLGNRPQGVKLLVARVPVNAGTDKRQLEQALENGFLARTEEAFAVSNSRTETRSLCGSSVPVQVTEGQLTDPNQNDPRPAIQYKASVNVADRRYVIRIVTRGQNAKPKAEKIFESLDCKQPQL
ncbi:MAG TPA: hypothetical protein V6D18_09420 [Thermosynechococcaceae cyanobacterium]